MEEVSKYTRHFPSEDTNLHGHRNDEIKPRINSYRISKLSAKISETKTWSISRPNVCHS